MTALVVVEKLCKSFGSLKVTNGLSFELHQGEALGVLGPNGAGKTTMFNLISGDLTADSGRISFKGEDVTRLPPHRRCRAGIGRSYPIALPFEGMTVFENLLVGAIFGGGKGEAQAYDVGVDILRRTGLAAKANRLAGSLTLLDRKRLELARALASTARGSPSASFSPKLITSRRVATCIRTCTTCSIQMIDTPWARIPLTISASSLDSCSVRPPAISSSNSTRGAPTRLAPRSSRRRIPPE